MPTFRGQRSVTGLANWFDTGAKAPRRNVVTSDDKTISTGKRSVDVGAKTPRYNTRVFDNNMHVPKGQRSVAGLANWFDAGAKTPRRNAETSDNKPVFKAKRSVADLTRQLSDVFVPRRNTGKRSVAGTKTPGDNVGAPNKKKTTTIIT